ncbi:MAG: NADH-quinone oxidoreductase subunit 5 family protein [Acidimicrobiia bacterium]
MTFAALDSVLSWVWLMPALMGLSFFAILFVGKRLPNKGSEIGIACAGLCFLFSLIAGLGWIGRVNDAGSGAEPHAAALDAHGGRAAAAAGQEPAGEGHGAEAPAPAEDDHGGETGPAEEEGHGAGAVEGEEHHQVEPVLTGVNWFRSGGQSFEVGTFVDGLSVMMLFVVTLISLLVHIYSTDYVGGDRRYTHYFAFLSLFTASMLMLVMSRNTVQFITSWELVGLCSYALIGHWWEEKPNSDAAFKAFLTNRVGDIGLLVGMTILFWATGSFDIPTINASAASGDVRHLLLLVASCCLIGAVMSKSGQFILHTWLPDAMAGPTPVSALIHAATMVVAGIFLVARFYGVIWEGLQIGTSHLNLLAVVGTVTLIGGGLLAFVQNDIKKVLAYSTVSQLGYMAMGLGVGAWTAAVFHLFTHAFFKAGLFLGSGSVAHSVHSFDMRKDMGGMARFMPKTFKTFVICSLALAAIPPLAGFWSKDEILAGAAGSGGLAGYPVMVVAGIFGGALTAAYMTRCIYLTFFGEPRGHAADPHHPPHESGPRIVYPLYILSGLAVLAGFANWPFGFPSDSFQLRFEHYVEPVAGYFPEISHPEFTPWVAAASAGLALAGIAMAYAYWFRGMFQGATKRSRLARAGYVALEKKYGLDIVYTDWIVGATSGPIARAVYWFDQNVVDGIVNGTAYLARRSATFVYSIDQEVVDGVANASGVTAEGGGQLLRRLQTGKVQQYGALLFGGAVVLAGVLVIAV